jgi:hypothetical protein
MLEQIVSLLRQIEVAETNHPFAPLEELSMRPVEDAYLVPAEFVAHPAVT